MKRTEQSASREARPSLLEAAGKPRLTAPYLDVSAVVERARRQRNEEIGRLFGRFFTWIEGAIERARQRDVEHFLSRATDYADLERRMRELEQGKGAFVK